MSDGVRVVIPDSHGAHIDDRASQAFLKDLKRLDPIQVVLIGDHLDCGGVFTSHARSYTAEIPESYSDDVDAANTFLDAVQKAAPRAQFHYLEGNHEARVERTASNMFRHKKDADGFLDAYGPAKVLGLRQREIRYYRMGQHYHGLSVPGTIRLGKCYFTHGISYSKHAAGVHLAHFGANVVFGHTHRSMSVVERTVTSDGIGAWCPGTLSELQPLYMHTKPTSWTHGYAAQFLAGSGRFMHVNVPIVKGESLLRSLV